MAHGLSRRPTNLKKQFVVDVFPSGIFILSGRTDMQTFGDWYCVQLHVSRTLWETVRENKTLIRECGFIAWTETDLRSYDVK
jgi:hypothetical protein